MSPKLKDPVTEQCEELWHRYRPLVQKLCEYKLQSAPNLIEDCVQEVFAALLAYLRSGNVINFPGAWLAKVANNKIKDIYTSENRRKQMLISLNEREALIMKAYFLDGRDPAIGNIRLEEILACLCENDRRIFTLFYFNGLTCEEISAAEGTSEAAVKQKLSRLKAKVLEQFYTE